MSGGTLIVLSVLERKKPEGIEDKTPEEVYEFMSLFPQPARTRPSVQYVPMPYRGNQDTSAS